MTEVISTDKSRDMMTLQESKGAKILFAFGGEGTACDASDLELCKACPSPPEF